MIKIIGHRGASENAPENTLSSISEAWSQLADGVEIDTRLTKDSALVCIHDTNTQRTAGQNAIVNETSLEELRKMDFGAWRGKEWMNEPIPLLSEVIELIPEEKKLFIEVKNNEEAVEPLTEILEDHKDKMSNISVISFNENVLKKIKEKFPDLTVNLLISFDKEKEVKSCDLAKKIKHMELDGLGLQSHMQLTQGFIEPILFEGKEVHVWTVDQPEEAKRYKELGLASITTNKPGQIKNHLLAS